VTSRSLRGYDSETRALFIADPPKSTGLPSRTDHFAVLLPHQCNRAKIEEALRRYGRKVSNGVGGSCFYRGRKFKGNRLAYLRWRGLQLRS